MRAIEQHLIHALRERQKDGNERHLPGPASGLDFCSNDYLGFASGGVLSPLNKHEVNSKHGATGSRLLTGNSVIYQEVEQQVADFHQAESALIFPSGYAANLGLLSAVPRRGDIILYDELCHASIRDGIRLSDARSYHFMHNDLNALHNLLERHQAGSGRIYVVTESVFSMDGDLAPLEQMVELCNSWNAGLIVDEAHAVGVIGSHGQGLVAHLDLSAVVMARVITFSKAVGGHGGAVLGSETLKNYLVNYSRPFIFTTGLPDHSLIHIRLAYNHLSTKNHELEKLREIITLFRNHLSSELKQNMTNSHTPIQPVLVSGNKFARELSVYLRENGFDIRPILHPTVPVGRERIRIILHACNTKKEVLQLCHILNSYSFS